LTFTAASGNEAFQVFEVNEFDAVVTDIRMPNGNGLELLDKIKKSTKSQTPVFLVTGFADVSKEEALVRGASDLIGKPYDIIELCTVILNHLKPKSQR
jgi:CheY-like chemotaxis protein